MEEASEILFKWFNDNLTLSWRTPNQWTGFYMISASVMKGLMKINENISFTDHSFEIRLSDCSKLPIIRKNKKTLEFAGMTPSSNFFWLCCVSLVKFGCWSRVHVNIMWLMILVLQLWQFSFIRDWPEIRKFEMPPSEFCPIFGDWNCEITPSQVRAKRF